MKRNNKTVKEQAQTILWALMKATQLGEEMSVERTIIENGLKEYASQQKDVPSDEEIEKNAREYADKYGGPDFGLAFKSYREGAKDIRDNYQPKQIDWYEFDKWVEKKCFRVPYDGSNDFYDQVQVKHYNECREWFKSKLK